VTDLIQVILCSLPCMIRWICVVHLMSKTASDELNNRLGIECITDIVRRSRLRWFAHVERKDSEYFVQHVEVLKLMD